MLSRIRNHLNKIYHLDLIAPRIEFNLNGRNKQTTISGVIFSIIIILVSYLSAKRTIANFFYKINPKINNQQETLSLNDSGLNIYDNLPNSFFIKFFSFNVTNTSFKELSNDEVPYPSVVFVKSNVYNAFENSVHFKMDSCSKEFVKDQYAPYLKNQLNETQIDYFSNTSFCFNKNTSFADLNLSYYNTSSFEITLDDSQRNVFKTKFVVLMNIYYRDVILQDNHTQPYSYIWKYNQIIVDTNSFYQYNLELKEITIDIYDPSFIFERKRPTKKIYVQSNIFASVFKNNFSIREIINTDKDLPFFTVSLRQSINKESIEIRYISLDDVIAFFGGTFSVVLVFFQVIYEIIWENVFKVKMINSIFSMHSNYITKKDLEEVTTKNFKNRKNSTIKINSNNLTEEVGEDNKKIRSNTNSNLNNDANNEDESSRKTHCKEQSPSLNDYIDYTEIEYFKAGILTKLINQDNCVVKMDSLVEPTYFMNELKSIQTIMKNPNEIVIKNIMTNNVKNVHLKDNESTHKSKESDEYFKGSDNKLFNDIPNSLNEKNPKTLNKNNDYNDYNEKVKKNIRSVNTNEKIPLAEEKKTISFPLDIENLIEKIKNTRKRVYITGLEGRKTLSFYSAFCNSNSAKNQFITSASAVIESKLEINNYFNLFYEITIIKRLLIMLSFNISNNNTNNNNSNSEVNNNIEHRSSHSEMITKLISMSKFFNPPSYNVDSLISSRKILYDYYNEETNLNVWQDNITVNDFINTLNGYSKNNLKTTGEFELSLVKNYLDSLL